MARAPEPAPESIDPDRLEGVSHPRETRMLFGQDAAERAFLAAWNAGRAHHAWLLAGPPGVGKASFAYRVARFLLRSRPSDAGLFGAPPPDESLDVDEEEPASRQVEAGAHPDLTTLRRAWNEKTKKFRGAISVDDVRRLIDRFHLSAADGGWRVAVVDPADEMNTAAANALLKLLEEPPAKAMFLLVSHAPGRLPATIRSRCRRLEFRQLGQEDAVAAMRAAAPDLDIETATRLEALMRGSPGDALRLHALGGLDTYAEVVALLSTLPALDRGLMLRLSEGLSGAAGADRLQAISRLLRLALERLARAGALGAAAAVEATPGEAKLHARLSPSPTAARVWAEAASEVADRFGAAIGLNLDPQRTILDVALYLEEASRQALRRS